MAQEGADMQQSELVAMAVLMVFCLIGGVGILVFARRSKKAEHEERRLMIEKGLVPPDWSDQGKRWTRDDFLRRGLVSLFVGIGLGITYYLRPDASALAFVSPTLVLFGLARDEGRDDITHHTSTGSRGGRAAELLRALPSASRMACSSLTRPHSYRARGIWRRVVRVLGRAPFLSRRTTAAGNLTGTNRSDG